MAFSEGSGDDWLLSSHVRVVLVHIVYSICQCQSINELHYSYIHHSEYYRGVLSVSELDDL